MARFARLNGDNVVTKVHVVANGVLLDENGQENEQKGIDFLQNHCNTSDTFVQTSYNTHGGVHTLGGTPLRKNRASPGMTYDSSKDAFIAPKNYASWVFDEDSCRWVPPVARPDEENSYTWNEDTTSWVQVNFD